MVSAGILNYLDFNTVREKGQPIIFKNIIQFLAGKFDEYDNSKRGCHIW